MKNIAQTKNHRQSSVAKFENDIRLADWRHPVDEIEPLEYADKISESLMRLMHALQWCSAVEKLSEMGARATQALQSIRPDLFALDPTLPASMPSDANRHEYAVSITVLAWINQGDKFEDRGMRLLVVLRALKFGTFGKLSYSEIAKSKGCSRQRVEFLHSEFCDTHGAAL